MDNILSTDLFISCLIKIDDIIVFGKTAAEIDKAIVVY